MARKDLREKLHDQVKESFSKGAKVLCGGVKDSGYGREHGRFDVREFVNAKAVMRLNK